MSDKRLAAAFVRGMIPLVSDLPDVIVFVFYAMTWVHKQADVT